jgi:hypothetical protein
MLNQTNVVPTPYVANNMAIPAMPVQSAIQPNVQGLSLQPVTTPIMPAQQVATKTTVVPDYGNTQLSQVPLASTVPIQSSVPVVNSVAVQPQATVISTQAQPKYRLWNMLVPVFQPEPQPIPQPVPQSVANPEPVTIPTPVEIPAETYEVPAEPVYTPTYEEPVYEEPTTTYTVPETQYVETTQYTTTASPNVRVIRRGSGITMNEQQNIINCAISVYQQKLEPISNNTAKAVKRTLGGDWLVIVYPEGKPIDFNMTCVQGNDYLYFIVDTWAFQVCRLR